MSASMIARTWRGRTRASDTDAYLAFLDRTGVADCRATPGNAGVLVLQRPVGDETEFLFVSLWADEDGIRGFAGADPQQARFYAEDDRFLVDRDEQALHYTVARDTFLAARENAG